MIHCTQQRVVSPRHRKDGCHDQGHVQEGNPGVALDANAPAERDDAPQCGQGMTGVVGAHGGVAGAHGGVFGAHGGVFGAHGAVAAYALAGPSRNG